MHKTLGKDKLLAEVYHNIFPWRNLDEFTKLIKSTIAYRSQDNSLIAICKPFGVGTHTVDDRNYSKQNQDKILFDLRGTPRYCLNDVLRPLTDEFNSKEPYQILKGIDRYMSGLVIITNNYADHAKRFKNALAGSRASKTPPYGLRAITYGYPAMRSNKIYEKVGVQLLEVDEFGDHKEAVIIQNPSKRYGNKFERDKTSFQVELEIKKINKELSVALVELYVSKLRYDFPRCYLSSKTSFILGDVRFSKRIKEILGKQIQVSAFRSSHSNDDYEPLNSRLRNLLGIYRNANIPLMLDLHALRLKSFDKGRKDLIIQSKHLPLHFDLTARKLDLLNNDIE